MSVTPRPWRTLRRADGVRIIVGPFDDNDASHTVAEVHVCDGTHPGRSHPDADLICSAVNWTASDERRRIAAWLRAQTMNDVADAIDDAEHLK